MYYPNRVDLIRSIIILRGRGISYNLEDIHLIDPALLYCWIIFYSLRGGGICVPRPLGSYITAFFSSYIFHPQKEFRSKLHTPNYKPLDKKQSNSTVMTKILQVW
jgi:hypothetical protein